MMKTSVIITVFNRRHLLEQALTALSPQTPWIDELVVSDDGSEEDVFTPVREFAAAHRIGVVYVSQADRGFRLAKCRNNAIREAGGAFLIFLDQDIVYTQGYLRRFLEKKTPGRYLVGYPVRLSREQSQRITPAMIRAGAFDALLRKEQIQKIHRQYLKDGWDYWIKRSLPTRRYRPKLRGGVCALFKEDLLRVNGYDENYQGWGGEDDDLGRRLNQAGVIGQNVFWSEYPLHLYHEPFHDDGIRLNREYAARRIRDINRGNTQADRGLSNPVPDDSVVVRRIQ